MRLKTKPLPSLLSPAESFGCCRNEISIDARHLEVEGQLYKLERGNYTPCDCGGQEQPSWSLYVYKGDIEIDQEARLWLPIIKVKGIPLLPLPYLQFSLQHRKTGLLWPRFEYSSRHNFILKNALFITLGRSADLTLQHSYLNLFQNQESDKPHLADRRHWWGLELRFRPHQTWWGNINFNTFAEPLLAKRQDSRRWLFDMHQVWLLSHHQFFTKIDLVSDRLLPAHLSPDLTIKVTRYRISRATWLWDYHSHGGGVRLNYIQNLALSDGKDYSLFSRKHRQQTMHHLPAMHIWRRFTINQYPLVAGRILSRFDHFTPISTDPFLDGQLISPQTGKNSVDPKSLENDIFDADEILLQMSRLHVQTDLNAALPVWHWAACLLDISYAHQFLHSNTNPDTKGRQGFFSGKITLETQLSRVFHLKRGRRIKHSIISGLEYLYIPDPFNTFNVSKDNYFDLYHHPQGANQLRFFFKQILFKRDDSGPITSFLTLYLAQGYNLPPKEAEKQWGELETWLKMPLSLADLFLYSSFDWNEEALSEMGGKIAFRLLPLRVNLNYLYLLEGGSGRYYRNWQWLFGYKSKNSEVNSKIPYTHELAIRPVLTVGYGLTLFYSAQVSLQDQVKQRILSQSGGLRYKSSCRCWSTSLALSMTPNINKACGSGDNCYRFLWQLNLAGLGNISGGAGGSQGMKMH